MPLSSRIKGQTYFFEKNSAICSLGRISDLNAYEPVFGERTILIHLVVFLPAPVLRVATTFFAIGQNYLISR